MRSMRDKRGVSPLIATVLLIAFAVALGAVVMNWGRSYVEQTAENVEGKSKTEIKCTFDIRLQPVEINDVIQICSDNTSVPAYVEFTLMNAGLIDIEGLQYTLIGSKSVISNSSYNNGSMRRGEVIKSRITYDVNTIGILRQIQLVPQIKQGSEITPCSAQALTKDSYQFGNCTS